MSTARVSVHVSEDTALEEHVFVADSGEPRAWLYIGGGSESAIWGSPTALRRMAAAAVVTAEHAESLLARETASGHRGANAVESRTAGRAGAQGGERVVMAIDDLLDRAREQRRRRDEACGELTALLKALDGLAGVGMLDVMQKRELGRLRDRPRGKRRTVRQNGAGRET
jgi:hypothetical protein